MDKRQVKRVISSMNVDMGGLISRQPLPNGPVQQLDPFLLLHHTGPKTFEPENRGLPFAPHPHKGFETVTFIFDGAVEHKDSTGVQSTIHKGGVQWMTAGKGIVHSENLPNSMIEHGGEVEYIQLWINLPAKYKSLNAKYHGLQKADIPEVSLGDDFSKVRVVSGSYDGVDGAHDSVTDIQAFEIYLSANGEVKLTPPAEHQVLFYVLEGDLEVNGHQVSAHQLVQFSTEGSDIEVQAKTKSRMLYCTGSIIDEPVVSHGPFVMNTQTEIMEAMRDYQSGKMGIITL